jgi:hypothetical protein
MTYERLQSHSLLQSDSWNCSVAGVPALVLDRRDVRPRLVAVVALARVPALVPGVGLVLGAETGSMMPLPARWVVQ